MKKLVTLSLVSAVTALVFIGCGGSTPEPSAPQSSHDAKTADNTFFSKHLTMEKAHKVILTAGEEAGWKMTEFKSNAIIAEKTDGEETTAVTISFNSDSFDINPENSDLADAISKAVENMDKKGH